MAEQLLQRYQDIPEADRKKAEAFLQRGNTVAGTGNYEYAIEMYLQGLAIDPESVQVHQTLRDVSLKRKASGKKDLGMFEKMKLRRSSKDDKQTMLNCEKLLAYDPGNTDHMLCILQAAHRAGFYDTVLWIGPILQRANADSGKSDYSKYQILKEIYKDLNQWKQATEVCQLQVEMRPNDMDLHTEMKNLSAQQTMHEGRYTAAGSFRDSIRDMEKQQRLMEGDKDVRTLDSMARSIREAEAEWQADPEEPAKLMKLVDALVKTEQSEYEDRAIQLLQEAYERTKQFRYRFNLGRIKLAQLSRQERSMRAAVQANPQDESIKQQYVQFLKDKAGQELDEFRLASENYPTDMGLRYQMAVRLFQLDRYDEAIPIFQQARSDPKYRTDAAIALGRSFIETGFVDEAVDTLRVVIDDYELRGDTRSKDMYYWYGRALELKNDPAALKAYSQVAQWDFNYRDVQGRIKRLRTPAGA